MKKLESIKGSKFELSRTEMNQIEGGTDPNYSYKSTTTILSGGETRTDLTAYDVCFDL
ncbi:MAG: hypothetical protein ACSHW7_02325 [Patiriisocius sp.]|uniref:hypothetical protein n=1 Tax=Patiriisocius sp. TaxID=2822396 RepID=UPI003EF9B918